MAEFKGCARTNYFRVKDEKAFLTMMQSVSADDDSVDVWEKTIDGKKHFAFGSYSMNIGLRQHDEEGDDYIDTETFLLTLKCVVADDDAIIITEVGNENLRYLSAYATVITSKAIRCLNLETIAGFAAREALGNPKWETTSNF